MKRPLTRSLTAAMGGSVLLALVCAAALDAMGATTIGFGFGWCAGAAVFGGLQAMVWPLVLARATDGAHVRRGAIGMVIGGATAFLLGRAPFGWLDLGAIAAGLPGEMPLVVLPVASVLAIIAAWDARRFEV